jgi:hypothetical protein
MIAKSVFFIKNVLSLFPWGFTHANLTPTPSPKERVTKRAYSCFSGLTPNPLSKGEGAATLKYAYSNFERLE